jgi:integrase
MLLHEAMDGAVKEGLIPFNPTEATTIPKSVKTEKTVLLESQIEIFIKAIEDDEIWHDFFYTAIMTGMRQGEICGLKWLDFDEENGTLHIQRSVRTEKKKLIIGETKTSEGNRKIVLPFSVFEMLKERKKNAISEWIFPKPHYPEHPVTPKSAYLQLKKILKKAELPDIRFHDLRHTFATHAASNGIDPKTLAGILGHTKASFTLDRYTHVTTDMQKQASSIVGNYITDIFGKELKPWESDEKADQEQ